MKKTIAFVILAIFLLNLAVAQIDNPFEEELEKLEETKETLEDLTDEEARSEYLKQEWTKIIEKSPEGKKFLETLSSLKKLNPFFKAIFGTEYAVSWRFIFAFFVFASLSLLLVWILWTFMENKIIAVISSVLITAIIGLSGAIRIILDFLGALIPNKWVALAVFVGFLIFFYIEGKQIKKEIKKTQEEQDKADIHVQAEAARAYLKGLEGDKKSRFEYKAKMKRGGTSKKRSRFVKKKSVERYTQRYGDEAAKKRFGS